MAKSRKVISFYMKTIEVFDYIHCSLVSSASQDLLLKESLKTVDGFL
jgi:hypothetical protein